MNYLEVKHEVKTKEEVDSSDFISNVISSQKTLGTPKETNTFEHNKLIELGFSFNKTTKGYSLVKQFNLEELKKLALEVNKLNNHILTHSYITLKIYNNELFFWDTALIYEGVDNFEYCLKHHNTFSLGNVYIVTKSNSVNEELLNLANYTKRYHEPSLEFITHSCLWDKQKGVKVYKNMVPNINEYISLDEVIVY